MKKQLIVVDMQNDFITGSLGSKEAEAIKGNVIEKIKELDPNNDFLIFTRDTHDSNYMNTLEGKNLPVVHCLKNSKGWEIDSDLISVSECTGATCLFFDKKTFGSTELGEWCHKYASDYEIVIVGLLTDICVISNALMIRAFCPNTKITIDSSCCAGSSLEAHNAALEVARSCQIEVI